MGSGVAVEAVAGVGKGEGEMGGVFFDILRLLGVLASSARQWRGRRCSSSRWVNVMVQTTVGCLCSS